MRCPTCHTTYPPEIRFCPVDGAPLTGGAVDELAALADAPAALPVPVQPALAPPARTSGAILAAVGVLGLAVVALAVVILLRPAAPAVVVPRPVERTAVVQPMPAEPAAPLPVTVEAPDTETGVPPAGDYRMISTPTDGYLSIRSEPDGRGSRLDRMLDGEVVEVLACGPTRVVDGDRGHWCRVRRQSGQTGWAYDAYLVVYEDSPM